MEKYTEILKLKEMLEQENIPFEFNDDFFGEKERNGINADPKYYPAYSLVIYKDGKQLCDAVEHYGSYGQGQDLLEIMGGLTMEEGRSDGVLGWLSADDVFKRFKYCYEHNTSEYQPEELPIKIGYLVRKEHCGIFEVTAYNLADCENNSNQIIEIYRYNRPDYELIWKKPREEQ